MKLFIIITVVLPLSVVARPSGVFQSHDLIRGTPAKPELGEGFWHEQLQPPPPEPRSNDGANDDPRLKRLLQHNERVETVKPSDTRLNSGPSSQVEPGPWRQITPTERGAQGPSSQAELVVAAPSSQAERGGALRRSQRRPINTAERSQRRPINTAERGAQGPAASTESRARRSGRPRKAIIAANPGPDGPVAPGQLAELRGDQGPPREYVHANGAPHETMRKLANTWWGHHDTVVELPRESDERGGALGALRSAKDHHNKGAGELGFPKITYNAT